MVLVILAFFGGALTILSPCILPVLPFVFARQGQSFLRSTLPLLGGMGATFAAVGTLAAVGGAWAVRVNTYGRYFALVLLAIFGIALLSKRVADWVAQPFVALGNRFLQSSTTGEASIAQSLVLGVATGFLWAPCAGPILGLILTGAAINGPSARTTLLLVAYALGAMSSLAIAMFAGARVFAALKQSLGTGEWVRRILGVVVLGAVVVIAMGLDTGVLTQLSLNSTNRIEQSLIDSIRGKPANNQPVVATGSGQHPPLGLPAQGPMPSLDGAIAWLNSSPLTTAGLRGKVVLIDFWTYSCINCLRALPHVKAWAEKYSSAGLVVIGVHSPEFAFERDVKNVANAVKKLGVTYPVAVDSEYKIWNAFKNEYWPAHYFIDAKGQIRHVHFGEGEYDESEIVIRQLLKEAGATTIAADMAHVSASGVEAAASAAVDISPETYVGYDRAEHFASREAVRKDAVQTYSAPAKLEPDQWALVGPWTVSAENALLQKSPGKILFHFHGRDLHLVLGPGKNGQPVRFKVRIDGAAPGTNKGEDVAADGSGTVTEQRLYQLIRLNGGPGDKTIEIEFLDPGVEAFAFTFG